MRPPTIPSADSLTLRLLVDDEPAADRKVFVRGHQGPVLVKDGEAHAVRVRGERLHAPEHVLVVRVSDRALAVQLEPARRQDRLVP